MDNPPPQRQISLKWPLTISAVLLLIIIAAGLSPRGFRLANKVSWLEDKAGIRFKRFGIAYSHSLNDSIRPSMDGADGFSIQIALKPATHRRSKFQFILALHDGKDSEQLVIGQWRSNLIFMNGDDYAYRRRIRRMTVDLASQSPSARFITLTSGKEGTRLYLDGKIVNTQKDLNLKIPPGGNLRLLLGNSVYGKQPWSGEILGLAFYNRILSSQKAAIHFDRWSKDRIFSFAKDEKASLLYLFDEMEGLIALDHSGGGYHLQIPLRMHVFERQILNLPSIEFTAQSSFIRDILINLFGFMPFGFVLFATLIRFGGLLERHPVLFTAATCLFVSLTIEIFQAWIPSRSSHLLDLVFNTLGGWVGALIGRVQGFQVLGSGGDQVY